MSQWTHWSNLLPFQMPSDYRTGCLHTNNPYRLQVDGSGTYINHGTNNYTYYTDGYVSAEIKVWSRNSDNLLSIPLVKTITTQGGLRECFIVSYSRLLKTNIAFYEFDCYTWGGELLIFHSQCKFGLNLVLLIKISPQKNVICLDKPQRFVGL